MTAYYSKRAIKRRRAVILRYLERRQLYPFRVTAEPSADLGLVVVIPCFDEPDVARTLTSLAACDPPGCDVEIIVVVNAPEGASLSAMANNELAIAQIDVATKNNGRAWLRFYGLQHDPLPVRHAGVGLARKIGMDEAAGRIASSQRCDGVIVSLDADCVVAKDFLYALRQEFDAHESCPGLSIYFEHLVSGDASDPMQSAMVNYELYLRYYVFGQRIAKFPYAFHTIGSAMACRGWTYAAQGGMNRRQGGEDFYFIQKLIALGGYRAMNATTVYPGTRRSSRVPFGTGPAIVNAMDRQADLMTYAPEVFHDLGRFCATVFDTTPKNLGRVVAGLPQPLSQFLEAHDFGDRLREIEANVSSVGAFRKRIFRWFNAFRFMKFAQFASREYYPRILVADAAWQLAASVGSVGPDEPSDPAFMLSRYRQLDKQAVPHEIFQDLR